MKQLTSLSLIPKIKKNQTIINFTALMNAYNKIFNFVFLDQLTPNIESLEKQRHFRSGTLNNRNSTMMEAHHFFIF